MANFTFRNLLFSLVQKRCLKTSSKISSLSQTTKDSNFAIEFLTKSCGLPLKSAISVSHKFQIQEKNEKKLQSVIDYLKDEGFTQSHIAKFIHKWPDVLHCKVEATLKPKLEFLKQNGFVGELLTLLIVKSPSVVERSVGSQMKPALEILKYYLKSDDKIVSAISRSSWLLTISVKTSMQPNIEFLAQQGVPASSIAKIITLQPRAIVQKHSTTIYAVNAVKNLGLQPTSPMFVHAFRVMISLSESSWKKKMEIWRSFGWTEEDILTAFKSFPYIMACSEGKIRKSMNFYMNTMKLDLQTIMKHPTFLSHAIDTRVRPRYIVLKILRSKKLVKADREILSFIKLTDKAFLDKYVIKYEDIVPDLLETYNISKKAEKIST